MAEDWKELETLLDRALDLEPGERTRFLDAECGSDSDLRQRLATLLAAAEGHGVLDQPLAEALPELVRHAADATTGGVARLEPRSTLGPYRILSLLGEGGMGEVFLAERADGQFSRRVAIKLERRSTAVAGSPSSQSRERFLRERQILADLRHPNIAQLLDGGITDDGRPYLVLEHVDGRPLGEYCQRHQLSREERLGLFLQACEAVHHAHRQGVLHRDLKPSNLLVESDPERGPRLYVLDFGLARPEATRELTVSGEVMGTPGYMAPEQARGAAGEVDRRADVFALGVVLYELLCGRRPFVGDNPVLVLQAVIGAEPPRPRSVVAGLPADLETIILTCLEKEPARRYGSVRALADDVRRYLDGEPIAARPAGVARRLHGWVRRHPARAAGTAALVLAAAVGALAVAVTEARGRQQAAVLERLGRQSEQVAVAMRLAHLAPLHDVAAERLRLAAELADLERELAGAGNLVRGRGLLALGRGALALGDLARAREQLTAARTLGIRGPESAAALVEVHAELYRRGREAIDRERDAGLRAARLDALANEHRSPALALLAELPAGGDDPAARLLSARLALLSGELERAIATAGAVLAAVPWRHEAGLLLGDAERLRAAELRAAGDTAGAEAALERAIAVYASAADNGRSDPAAHMRVCAGLADQIDLRFFSAAGSIADLAARATAACELATRADSGWAEPLVAITAVEVMTAREANRGSADPFPALDRAVAAGARALALDPASAAAHRRLLDTWAFRAEFERDRGIDPGTSLTAGLVHAERATALAPDDGGVWNSVGLLHWERLFDARQRGIDQLAPVADAIGAFERASELAPRSLHAWSNLGAMRKERGLLAVAAGEDPRPWFDAAIAAYQQASALDPRYANALNNQGVVWQELAKWQAGRDEDPRPAVARVDALCRQALAINPRWSYPWLNLAIARNEEAHWLVARGEDASVALQAAREAAAEGVALQPGLAIGRLIAADIAVTAVRAALAAGRSPAPATAAARAAIAAARTIDPTLGAETERALAEALATPVVSARRPG